MFHSICRRIVATNLLSKHYWTRHNVTLHKSFSSVGDSLEYFHWRNDQYHHYINLMPVSGYDNKVVLDYGCGPGNDLVGFSVYSKTMRLIGVDISESSLSEAKARLLLHGANPEFICVPADSFTLPLEDATIDHIHSSGVLHHTSDPVAILREFFRVLRPGGTANVMVYNRDSLWVHLYVEYVRTIVKNLYPKEMFEPRFRRSTDGENCPISRCYRPNEWINLCASAGFDAQYLGAAVSMHEMGLLPQRFAAIQDPRLPTESRLFLRDLSFDDNGYPLWNGVHAGIDACFHLKKSGES
jgi:ubiquinone/menaquinone biosynthesis C-methylase UbiE